ncbi:hypothetical protein EYF80_041064 [Liparis tanakae]|uniref:Uncharacterized protein n=1 Tax=Liparis tanakae TaxID=230148 RepID=A0A4Z2G6I2_9TELE|nr:hypothetical protein EYF80_041064 [Liparis tanakae]
MKDVGRRDATCTFLPKSAEAPIQRGQDKADHCGLNGQQCGRLQKGEGRYSGHLRGRGFINENLKVSRAPFTRISKSTSSMVALHSSNLSASDCFSCSARSHFSFSSVSSAFASSYCGDISI